MKLVVLLSPVFCPSLPQPTNQPHTPHNQPNNQPNSISELATAEEGYAKATLKLVKKSGYHPNPPTNASFASFSSDTTTTTTASSSSHGGFRRCMEREGTSVRAAWQGYMAAQARIGAIHAGTAAQLATSACVLLAQTQDELSGTRQEILVTAAASTKALAAARAVYAKARGKSEGKAKELADRSQELRAVSAAATPSGEGGEGGSGGGGGAAELKQQQKLEAKLGLLREEAAATDAAREAAEDALAAQRAQIVAQVSLFEGVGMLDVPCVCTAFYRL
jgi:hypothetical protein